MHKYLSLCIILLALLAGCKKEKISPEPTPDDGPSYTYLPLMTGDTWNYIHNGDNQDTISSTVGRESYVVNGYGYSYVASNGDEAFYTQIGEMYYMLVTDLDVDIPVPILDESGGFTTETDTSVNVTNSPRILTTLSTPEYGISKTVNGKTYDTVIHTRLDLEFPDDELRSPENYDFYFARNIGIIELDKGIYGGINDTRTLISFTYDPNTTLGHRINTVRGPAQRKNPTIAIAKTFPKTGTRNGK